MQQNLDTCFDQDIGERTNVVLVAMNTPRRQQPNQVAASTRGLHPVDEHTQFRVRRQGSIANRGVNSR